MTHTNRKKIMIVEDDVLLNNMYQTKIKNDGYDVSMAFNGAEAIDKIRLERPDAIISDVMMPNMNGLRMLEVIRQDDELRNIPVIMISNNDKELNQTKAEALNVNEYFLKADLTPAEVIKAVEKYI